MFSNLHDIVKLQLANHGGRASVEGIRATLLAAE
jgi:hypothetical protein